MGFGFSFSSLMQFGLIGKILGSADLLISITLLVWTFFGFRVDDNLLNDSSIFVLHNRYRNNGEYLHRNLGSGIYQSAASSLICRNKYTMVKINESLDTILSNILMVKSGVLACQIINLISSD